MPSYKTHIALNLSLGLPLSLAALKYTVQLTPYEMASFALAFVYGTYFLHPDMDLARNIRLFSLKGLLTLPFRPYSYLFRHRGISHMPIIGTLTRVIWLLVFLWTLFTLLKWVFPIDWNQPYLWFGLAGLAIADLFHVVLDNIS